jgi:hypothetical protein
LYGWNDPEGLGFWGFLDCLNDCIQRNDPFSDKNLKEIVVILIGQPYPKAVLISTIERMIKYSLINAEKGNQLIRTIKASIKMGASNWTTFPSTAATALKNAAPKKALKALRGVGRAASTAYVTYGVILAEIETECALACFLDSNAGNYYDTALGAHMGEAIYQSITGEDLPPPDLDPAPRSNSNSGSDKCDNGIDEEEEDPYELDPYEIDLSSGGVPTYDPMSDIEDYYQ